MIRNASAGRGDFGAGWRLDHGAPGAAESAASARHNNEPRGSETSRAVLAFLLTSRCLEMHPNSEREGKTACVTAYGKSEQTIYFR